MKRLSSVLESVRGLLRSLWGNLILLLCTIFVFLLCWMVDATDRLRGTHSKKSVTPRIAA